MSKYTTEVRFICESKAGYTESQGYEQVDTVIEKAWSTIFDNKFPIFDEAYRGVLCQKILRHYYTREIGAETAGLWVMWLNTKMREIMPYYNQLYKSELLEFNPFYDVDLKRTHNRTNSGTTNENSTGEKNLTGSRQNSTTGSGNTNSSRDKDTTDNSSLTGTKYDLYSDTPQGALTGVDNEEYLTNARKIKDNNSTTGSSNTTESANANNSYNESNTTTYGDGETNNSTKIGSANSTEDYLESVIGKQGGADYSSLLLKYRQTFINIDMQIIDELENLFMQLW